MKKNRSSTASSPTESITELIKQLEDLLAEAETVRQVSLRGQSEESTGMWSALRQRFLGLSHHFETICSDARDRVVARARAADDAVRGHPYEGIAVAMGVGVLLGALVRRR
jgi:ElaB/YqjD/DUF883 family membrane-anchored ribosome-binding protein